MADDVVGIRYVSAGLPEVLREIKQYQSAVAQTARTETQRATTSKNATRSADTEARRYYQNYLRYQRETEAAALRTARAQETAARQVQAATQRADQQDRQAYQSYLRYQREKEMAAQRAARVQETAARQAAAAEAQALRQAEQATRQLAAEKERLAMKYTPLYAASKQYENALNEINRAQQLGVLSAKQQEAALESLNAEFMAFQSGTAGWSNQFVSGATRGAREVNRMGMVMQQTGYQVGDFLVQVQSGTNWMVAFGQQATQLAGLIGLVNPALIGVGAALGIIIPLATALGAAWMRTRDAAKKAEANVRELGQAISSLDSIQQSTAAGFEAGLNKAFDDAASSVGRLLARLREAEFAAAMQPVRDALDSLSVGVDQIDIAVRSLSGFEELIASGQRLSTVQQRLRDDARRLVEENLVLAAGYDQVRGALDRIGESRTTDDLIENLAAAIDIAERLGGPVADQLVDALVKAAQEAGVYDAAVRRAQDETAATARAAGGLNDELSQATGLAATLLGILGRLPGAMAGLAGEVDGIITGLERQNTELNYQLTQSISASAASIKALRDEALATAAANGATIDQLAALGQEFDNKAARADELSSSIAANQRALAGQARAVSSSGGAASKAAEQVSELVKEVERLNEESAKGRTPLERYNTELRRLNELRAAGLSDGAYAAELERINEEFAKASPIINSFVGAFEGFLNGSIDSFKDFARKILQDFRNLLAQMIATALRNEIVFNMTGQVAGGVGGAAGQVAGAAGQAGGMLGNLGTLGSSLIGGAGNVLSATFGAGGSLGLGAASIGGQVGAAFAAPSIASIGAAIGAVAVPLLAVAAVFSFFRKKTKELDSGIRITVDNLDTLVESFRTTETKRFWGLSKKVRTNVSGADPELADPVIAAVADIQRATVTAAQALGIAEDAFEGFTTSLDISLKGLSEEQAMQAIQDGLNGVGSAMAEMIPNLDAFRIGSETAGETLFRLSNSLTLVNSTFAVMDYQLFATSLAGANMASSLVNLMGGLQGFSDATSFFVANFYTDAEQLQVAANALHAEFAALNMTTPETAMQFRALIEAQDLTTQSGQETYAQLMRIAPAFINVANAAAQAANTANAAAARAQSAASGAVAAQAQAVTALTATIPAQQSVAAAQAQANAAAQAQQAALQKAMEQAAAAARRQASEAAAAARASAAQAAAQQAANAAAQAAKQIADERYGLETRYYQAIGDTVTLREREIAALNPANQAFGRMVIMLEEAKRAADALSESDFASQVAFNRARALALNNATAPVPTFSTNPTQIGTQTIAPSTGGAAGGTSADELEELRRANGYLVELVKKVGRLERDVAEIADEVTT